MTDVIREPDCDHDWIPVEVAELREPVAYVCSICVSRVAALPEEAEA